ncbi:hypothetical protein [Frigoribacterium sp. VKM Ac-2836]|uniref:hypothetical protein n=1 Tax=Frigoribacterium sp. VKM Ac-2836 TaxID=2739014 RepID=UPI0015645F44|nr:hypothetical protein [Frigoribacterium sp. VKM Ac-2836]NRD26258.1 hypothetical protein [Frigoribacterium sp. VKM Ac-2836]
MTSSNRFANRLLLFVVGLVTLAVGAFLVIVALPGGGAVRDLLPPASSAVDDAVATTGIDPGDSTGGSWLTLALALLCLLLVIVFVVAIFARGHGRTDSVVVHDDPAGSIAVSSSFAETAITDALGDRRDVASVAVSAWTVTGRAALKVRVRLTAGSSPAPVVTAASDVARGLDRVLGETVPVLVEITGASAVRKGADSRVS